MIEVWAALCICCIHRKLLLGEKTSLKSPPFSKESCQVLCKVKCEVLSQFSFKIREIIYNGQNPVVPMVGAPLVAIIALR